MSYPVDASTYEVHCIIRRQKTALVCRVLQTWCCNMVHTCSSFEPQWEGTTLYLYLCICVFALVCRTIVYCKVVAIWCILASVLIPVGGDTSVFVYLCLCICTCLPCFAKLLQYDAYSLALTPVRGGASVFVCVYLCLCTSVFVIAKLLQRDAYSLALTPVGGGTSVVLDWPHMLNPTLFWRLLLHFSYLFLLQLFLLSLVKFISV